MDKFDMLFLEKDCPECATVRAVLSIPVASDDKFRGPKQQGLLVIVALSNAASEQLLAKFGHADRHMPLLVAYDGTIIDAPKRIAAYLKDNRMSM